MHIHMGIDSNSNSRNGAAPISMGKLSRVSKGSKASKTSKGVNLISHFNGETTLDDAFKHSFYNSNMMNTGDNRSSRSPFGVAVGSKRNHRIPIGTKNGKDGAASRSGRSKGTNSVKSTSSKTYQINGADFNVIKNYNEN